MMHRLKQVHRVTRVVIVLEYIYSVSVYDDRLLCHLIVCPMQYIAHDVTSRRSEMGVL